MINLLAKSAYENKKGVLFYATRDARRRADIGINFLLNMSIKRLITAAEKTVDDLEYYPSNYSYEAIKTIFDGKYFSKNFNFVFKNEIDIFNSEKVISQEYNSGSDSQLKEIINKEKNLSDKVHNDFINILNSVKYVHKTEKEKRKNLNNYTHNFLTEAEKREILNSLNIDYNPYTNMEKSTSIEQIDYNKLNIFKYFLNYGNFIKGLEPLPLELENNGIDNIDSKNKIVNEKGTTFTQSLCMIFIGNNIHQRIFDEISRRTSIFILKGDYFFSLGYNTIASLGNPYLIRLYSKINENFAKSIFFKANIKAIENKSQFFAKLFDYVIRKNIGFYYLGCLGLSELYNKKYFQANKELVKEFSFKYGILLYLREELAFLKDKSTEYYAKAEELIYSIFIYSEKLMNELCFDNSENYLKNLNKLLSESHHLDKYKYFAISLCSDLFLLIEKMYSNIPEQEEVIIKKNEMKDFLKMIFLDIEEMIRI